MYKHRTVAGIPAAEILKLQPGDILALSYTHSLTDRQVQEIIEQLKDTLPEGVKSVLLDRDAKFQVIRTSKDEAS